MYGDQWKSELARLLHYEQRRRQPGRSSAATVGASLLTSLFAGGGSGRGNSGRGGSALGASSSVTRLLGSAFRAFGGGSTNPVSGMARLVTGIVRLFSGSHAAPAPKLPKFALPTARAYQGVIAGPRSAAGEGRINAAGISERAQGPVGASSITVQVQAMDSKSFLDHSDAIATAVRKAMLESHSLNSVVADL